MSHVGKNVLIACVAAGFACVIGDPAQAEIAVAAGRSVTIGTLGSFDQACHSQGSVAINLLQPPSGGAVHVDQVRAYPNFLSFNTRSRCNTRKLPSTRITYQSSGAFIGYDPVVYEAIFPDGAVRRYRVVVSVRPFAQ